MNRAATNPSSSELFPPAPLPSSGPESHPSPPNSSITHPAQRWRPVVLGVVGFMLFNLLFTILVTGSSLNQRFNFKYGNFLPVKLQLLKDQKLKGQTKVPDSSARNVLFLGTSQTNNGFIPALFDTRLGHGVKSFNLGLPNNRYDIMLATLQLYQRRYGKPQLVLVELSPSIQEKESRYYYLPALYYRTLIEQEPDQLFSYLSNPLLADNVKQELLTSAVSSLRQYRNTFSPVNILNKVGGKLGQLTQRLPVLANAPAMAEAPSVASVNDSESGLNTVPPAWVTDELLAGGWYPKAQSIHMKTPQGVAESVREARKYYIDAQTSVNFEKLLALLAYCKRQGIPVALVTWPNHPAYVQAFQQSHLYPAYQQGVARLLREHPVIWIDLNRHWPAALQAQTPDVFADPRHLTPEGARGFSQTLADLLTGPS